MIIIGGFNVYSAEVEQALLAHPALGEAAVVGLPDEKWGERVTAVIELRAGYHPAPDELISFVKQRIGSIKAPKEIQITTSLPRSKIGKVLKAEVRTRLLSYGITKAQHALAAEFVPPAVHSCSRATQ